MAKFIIEVDDNIIREKLEELNNVEKFKELVKDSDDFLTLLLDMTTFSILKQEIEKGITEFHLQRDFLSKKMYEAGYEWDAEKLEPRKVPKPKEPEGALKQLLDEQDKLYEEAKIVLEDKDTALAFLRRTGIIDEYGELAEKYRSEQKSSPTVAVIAVDGTNSTGITDGNTSVTMKEVEVQYCTGNHMPRQEWSDRIDIILERIEKGLMIDEEDINLLKSLKDRISPKQEWSEEDEKMYLSIMSVLLSTIGNDKESFTVTREMSWIKSLKERIK